MKKSSLIILGSGLLVFMIGILVVLIGVATTLSGKSKKTPTSEAQAAYPAPKTTLAQNIVGNPAAYPPPSTMTRALTQTTLPVKPTTSPTQVVGLTVDDVQHITIEDAKAAFDGKKAIFLDVRSAESYTSSHITGAISIPEAQITERLTELDPDQWIITYCS